MGFIGGNIAAERCVTELEHTTEIKRAAEEIFAVVADPHNDRRWCPRVRECHQVVGDRPRVGARYHLKHRPAFHRAHIRRIEIVQFDHLRRAVSIQEDEVARFTISYSLEPSEAGTRLTQRDEIEWRIPRLSRPLAKLIVRRHLRAQLATLKQLLESNATP